MHWRLFVKHRLCLNFLLAFQVSCWGSHWWNWLSCSRVWGWYFCLHLVLFQLGFFCYPLFPSGCIRSLVISSIFNVYTRGLWHCHSEVGPGRHSANNSNWYFSPIPWSSPRLPLSASFHRLTLCFPVPCEHWLTVNSPVSFAEETYPKSTRFYFQLVFSLYSKQRNRYHCERSVELLVLLSSVAGLWKGCSCFGAVLHIVQRHDLHHRCAVIAVTSADGCFNCPTVIAVETVFLTMFLIFLASL